MGNDKVLIVDDDINSLKMVEQFLSLKKYETTCSLTSRDALNEISEGRFGAVVLDYFLPDKNGLEMMKDIRTIDPELPVIILTGARDIKLAVTAIKEGAFSYQTKPVDPDELYSNLEKSIKSRNLQIENIQLKEHLKEKYHFDSIVGNSGRMNDVYEMTHKAAKVRSTLLVTGETGSGKELIAKAVHYNSDRRDGPLIRVNCAAVPETLLEAELFGIEKNVASGVDARIGKFEAADKGTLFLDEIGDMSINTQAKVLRAMQEREIERVGSHKPLKVDIRIIAATHKNLEAAITDGSFRRDLYFRINVLLIHIPPLKERTGDIPDLCQHFLEKYCAENGLAEKRISDEANEKLMGYGWPGNVRELENTIERAVVVSEENTIHVKDLPLTIRTYTPGFFTMPDDMPTDLESAVAEFEKGLIESALRRNGWRQNKTAEELGITERSIWYKIKKYGIAGKAPGQEL